MGTNEIYGLVGLAEDRSMTTLTASYWDNSSITDITSNASNPDQVITQSGARGLTTAQLQNCRLNGAKEGGDSSLVCALLTDTTNIFPADDGSGNPLWGNRTNDTTGETNGWIFVDGEYPYLFAKDGEGKGLLPSPAEQKCQRNRFYYNLPCEGDQ